MLTIAIVTAIPMQAVAAVGQVAQTVQATPTYITPTRRLVGPIHHQPTRVRYVVEDINVDTFWLIFVITMTIKFLQYPKKIL